MPKPMPPPRPLSVLVPLLDIVFVVILNVLDTHPIVRIVLMLVAFEADDIFRNTIRSHGLTAPVRVVNGVLLILYSPPIMETMVCPSIPVIFIGLDT